MGIQTREAGWATWASHAGRADAGHRTPGPPLRWRALLLWVWMASAARDDDDRPVCWMSRDSLALAYGMPHLSLTDVERRAQLDSQQKWVDQDLRQLVRVGALRRLVTGGNGHRAVYEIRTARPDVAALGAEVGSTTAATEAANGTRPPSYRLGSNSHTRGRAAAIPT